MRRWVSSAIWTAPSNRSFARLRRRMTANRWAYCVGLAVVIPNANGCCHHYPVHHNNESLNSFSFGQITHIHDRQVEDQLLKQVKIHPEITCGSWASTWLTVVFIKRVVCLDIRYHTLFSKTVWDAYFKASQLCFLCEMLFQNVGNYLMAAKISRFSSKTRNTLHISMWAYWVHTNLSNF